MDVKEELRRVVDALDETHAGELLEYASWLQEASETLSPEEIDRVRRGEEQLQRGESVSWEDLRRDLAL